MKAIKADFRHILMYWNAYPSAPSTAVIPAGSGIPGYVPVIDLLETIAGADPTDSGDQIYKLFTFGAWNVDNLRWTLASEDVGKLLAHVFNRYDRDYMVIGEYDDGIDDPDFIEDMIKEFDRFIFILDSTYPKYHAILSAIKTNENNLINSVERSVQTDGTGTAKNKDTPQADIDPSSDAYNSNVSYTEASQTTTETDGRDLAIDKIRKLRDQYDEIMREWTEAFDDLFTSSANY